MKTYASGSNVLRFMPAAVLGALLGSAAFAGSALAQTPAPIAPPPGDVYAVNAGGGAAGGYTADSNFIGGFLYSNTSKQVYTQDVPNAAPSVVYQDAREGDHFSYKFGKLQPTILYAVILHFAELYWQYPTQREFNITMNGVRKETDFDIVAKAGAPFTAFVNTYLVRADANGAIEIDFDHGSVDQPSVNAIEIRGDNN